MPLNFAFYGTGYINRIHAEALQSIPNTKLVAVVNPHEKKGREFAAEFDIPRYYLNPTDLLNDGQVDAVVIGTPNYLHAEQTIKALVAGVHVLVEKPMAMTAAEADAMMKASQASGKLLMVAHCRRFEAEVEWLRQQVLAGRLGKVFRSKGVCSHVHWGPGGWFREKQLAGGGALLDLGSHAVDTARFLLGDPEPVSVFAHMANNFCPDSDVEDTTELVITWENDAVSYVESGWYQPHADGQEAATQLYGTGGFGQIFPTFLELPGKVAGSLERVESGFPVVREFICPQSMYNAQMAYFVGCITRNEQPVPGGRDGWINMRILEAAYQSAQTGQVVMLNSYKNP